MNHVLICGAAGYTNLGDDAILWGMLTDLRAAVGSRRIRVAGGPELGPLAEASGATPVSYEDRAELARAIEEAELVLLGGGGMLYDFGYEAGLVRLLAEPPDRQWLYELTRIAAAARAAGRPVMIYGMGAGPLSTEAARRVARFLGEQAVAITLRDRTSADLLVECGLPRSRLQVTADPAVSVDRGPAQAAQAFLAASGLAARPRPWVGFNFRPWYRFGREPAGKADALDRMIAAGGAVVREVCARLGGTAIMLPFQHKHDDDAEIMDSILQAAERPANAVLMAPPRLPPDIVAALAEFDVMVGMRLHALMLAMNAGLPFVGLAYEKKVEEFVQAAGLGEHLQQIEDMEVGAVATSCQVLVEQREAVSARLAARRDQMREAASISAQLAGQILRGRSVRPAAARAPVRSRSAKAIRVLMQTRPDYQSRPGGDVLQLTEIIPLLAEAGVQADLTGELAPDLSNYDLVHTINLDRPEEAYQHCLNALQQGRPVVVSPVHTEMSEFLEWGDTDYWELPGPDEGRPQPRRAPLPDPVERRRRALQHAQRQAILDWATVYLPNAQMDAEYLHQAFAMDLSRTVVVPHGIAELFFQARPEAFIAEHGWRDFVLCAARVEKRKNQLALIAALRGTGIPLVIIGQPNPEEYRELCRRYADDKVLFLDAMPQQALASAYAAAKVHALASWFEIPGLVSLEAGAAGCNIVSTDRGSPREYLQDMAWYCDPRRIESIREAVLAAYQAPRSDRLREHIRHHYSWQRAAERTREGYQLALALHADRPTAERQADLLAATQRHADWLAKLAADRQYEAQQVGAWARDLEALSKDLEQEVQRLKQELEQVTSRRLYRWSEAFARTAWSLMRALGIKR